MPGFGIRRLNHAVLFVAEVERAVRFYQDVLGFHVTTSFPGRAAFLRASDSGNHHDLGLFAVGPGGAPRAPDQPGLYHLAWQVDTIDELAAARTGLAEAGALVGESSHGATKSLYAKDPDGNEFEIMWMLPQADWGEYATTATTERLDLAAEVERWTGVGTADELGATVSTG